MAFLCSVFPIEKILLTFTWKFTLFVRCKPLFDRCRSLQDLPSANNASFRGGKLCAGACRHSVQQLLHGLASLVHGQRGFVGKLLAASADGDARPMQKAILESGCVWYALLNHTLARSFGCSACLKVSA